MINLDDINTPSTKNIIIYNYPETPVYPNLIQKKCSMPKCIQYPYVTSAITNTNIQLLPASFNDVTQFSGSSTTNASKNVLNQSMSTQNSSFTSNIAYIYGKIHNIGGIDYNGEMIIEHSPITNGGAKLFVCFLLKTDTQRKNPSEIDTQRKNPSEIDTIIIQSEKPTKPIPFHLNKLINQTTYPMMHIDNNNKIIVFTTPIPVKTDFKDFANTANIFSLPSSKNDYVILKNDPMELNSKSYQKWIDNIASETELNTKRQNEIEEERMKNKERNRQLDIIKGLEMDKKIAVATGATGKEKFTGFREGMSDDVYIDCQPTGETAENIATYNLPINSNLMNDINKSDFMKTTINFFLFLIVCFAEYMVVPIWYKSFIMDMIHSGGAGDEVSRLKAVDIFLCIFIFTFSISLSIDGIKTKNVDQTTVGVMSFILLIVSMIIMINKKSTDDAYSFVESANSRSMADFYDFLIDTLSFVRQNKTEVFFVWLFVTISVWAPTLWVYYKRPEWMHRKEHLMELIAGMWASYGTIFSIYLTKMIKLKLANYD